MQTYISYDTGNKNCDIKKPTMNDLCGRIHRGEGEKARKGVCGNILALVHNSATPIEIVILGLDI